MSADRHRGWNGVHLSLLLAAVATALLFVVPRAIAARSDGVGGRADGADTPLRFLSWALAPNGREAIFVLGNGGKTSILRYQDLKSGRSIQLARESLDYGASLNLNPIWSPDGKQVAYVYPTKNIWRVHVWERETGANHVFLDREACARSNGCALSMQWTPDSTQIYFLAKPTQQMSSAPISPSALGVRANLPAWREILLADPEHGGITVRESQAAAVAAVPTGTVKDARIGAAIAEVAVANLSAMKCDTLVAADPDTPNTDDPNIYKLSLAPSGQALLVEAAVNGENTVRQGYANMYLMSIPEMRARHHGDSVQRVERTAIESMTPILHRIPLGPTAWSPDSRRIAFGERGALVKGEISVFDVVTGSVTVLTDALTRSEEEEPDDIGITSLDEHSPHGKFSDGSPLAWSPRSDAVYTTRETHLKDGWRTRLWKLPLAGAPINLSVGSAFDLALPILTPEMRDADHILVPFATNSGEAGFLTLSESTRAVAVRVRLGGSIESGVRPQPKEIHKGSLLFVSEGHFAPEEAFLMGVRDWSIRRVTSLNAHVVAAASLTQIRRIDWREPAGDRRGYLYLSPAAKAEPPLIVQVYPGSFVKVTTYLGSAEPFLPPAKSLLELGYAIFIPDIPVAGHGATCDDLAQNIELALDAIAHSRLADVTRSAVLGHSFGGWAANCLIGKTHRFRAAISVSGIADMFTEASSPADRAVSWAMGGGQTNIGASIQEAPALYWKESPISSASNIATPLLLIHGKTDESVPAEQSVELYTALSRLGKDVTLVTYDDAGHTSVLSHPDYGPRVIAWVRQYLGDP
jgi:dipeptidyl aminopeptidase/acylaminoacyl peptidase